MSWVEEKMKMSVNRQIAGSMACTGLMKDERSCAYVKFSA